MLESGFESFNQRPSVLIPLIIRAIDSESFYKSLNVVDEEAVTLEDLKGTFVCLVIGTWLATLFQTIKILIEIFK